MKLSSTAKTAVFFGIAFVGAIVMDRVYPVYVDVPRAVIFGAAAFILLLLMSSIGPFLTWKSPSLIVYGEENIPVVIPLHSVSFTIAKSRNENIPDMVVIRSGINVGQIGLGRLSNFWIIAPTYFLERFGRHFILNCKLFNARHRFEDFPWIVEALEANGYEKEGRKVDSSTVLIGATTFLTKDIRYELFDLERFKTAVKNNLESMREPERMTLDSIFERVTHIRELKTQERLSQPPPPQPQVQVVQQPLRRREEESRDR